MALKLNSKGIEADRLYVVLGGLAGWEAAGYPIEAGG